MENKKVVRILSISGGGIRGLIPASFLAKMEEESGTAIWKMFDLIAGTSTGGILACILASESPMSASEAMSFYLTDGPKIFYRSFLRKLTSLWGSRSPKYSNKELLKALKKHMTHRALGEMMLVNTKTELLVPSYDLSRESPYFFKTSKARKGPAEDFRLWEVAAATSSAPTYFPPFQQSPDRCFIDGGVFANNPVMCAFAEAYRLWPGAESYVVISVGTGSSVSFNIKKLKRRGLLTWALPLLDAIFDGSEDTAAYQVSRMVDSTGSSHFLNLMPKISKDNAALDNTSDNNLRQLMHIGTELYLNSAFYIREVSQLLLKE